MGFDGVGSLKVKPTTDHLLSNCLYLLERRLAPAFSP